MQRVPPTRFVDPILNSMSGDHASSRSSRALVLDATLQEIMNGRESRLVKAEKALDMLHCVAAEVGVYGDLLLQLKSSFHHFIFCDTEYSVVVPPHKIETLARLFKQQRENIAPKRGKAFDDIGNDHQSTLDLLHNKPYFELVEDLTASLQDCMVDLKNTQETLRASLEQRQMAASDAKAMAQSRLSMKSQLAKAEQLAESLRADLSEEKRDADERNQEIIRGQALMNRKITAMQNTIARDKDQIKQLQQYRNKVESVRVTFKMFGNEGSGDYHKHIEPKRSLVELEMLILQLKKLYDNNLAAFENIRWDSSRAATYVDHARVELGKTTQSINSEAQAIKSLVPSLSTGALTEPANGAKINVFRIKWDHPEPTLEQVRVEFIRLLRNASTNKQAMVVTAGKGLTGGTGYEKYIPIVDYVEEYFVDLYGGDPQTGARALRAYMGGLSKHKTTSKVLNLVYKSVNGFIASHIWRILLEFIRIVESSHGHFDLSSSNGRRQFLKQVYVGDVPVSMIFQLIEEADTAYIKRATDCVEHDVQRSQSEIMLEYFAEVLLLNGEARISAFAQALHDRDLTVTGKIRLEPFHDACMALLPGNITKDSITSSFRATAYETMVERFGMVNDNGDTGAFARLMAAPVPYTKLSAAMCYLKLQTVCFAGRYEGSETVISEDAEVSMSNALNHMVQFKPDDAL